MNTIDQITTDEIIRLFSPAITSLEEHKGLLFHGYEENHVWVDWFGKSRRGIFVFVKKEHGTPRLYTADYLIAKYGV